MQVLQDVTFVTSAWSDSLAATVIETAAGARNQPVSEPLSDSRESHGYVA
jgi:hypothetical protein